MRKQIILLLLIILCSIFLVEAMWALDFAMWNRSVWLWIPFLLKKHYSAKLGNLGEIVVIKYAQIAICFIISTISAYLLGKAKEG